MPTLYVTHQGAVVRLAGSSLLVTAEVDPDGDGPLPPHRTVLVEVEPHRLELIALVGRVHITADAVQLCLAKGIGVAWFTWNGRFQGRLTPEAARSGDLRLAQFRVASEPAAALALARQVVIAKGANAAAVLRGLQSNYPGLDTLASALRALGELPASVAACEQAEVLLGLEGNASRVYFDALGLGFRADIGFAGRQRRPPPDPANALLSFGYVMLGNLLGGLLEARGLDPAV